MNRVKLWVFTVLVAAAGFLLVRAATISRRADVVAALDARLASAAAHVAVSTRVVANEASAAATLVARDDKLLATLHAKEAAPPAPAPAKAKRGKPVAPPPSFEAEEASLREAAREALLSAERTLGFSLPGSTVVTAGNRAWIARKGEPASDGDAVGFLRGAIGGQPRRGHVRLNGGLWFASAVPAGEGAGVVVLVPLDDMWARVLAVAAGADVTLSVPDAKPVSTARPIDVSLLHGATKLAGAGDVGPLGAVDVSVGPLKLPRLPQPVAGGAALRARAVPIQGVNSGFIVVSVPAAAALDAAAAFHWRALLGIVMVLLVGLVLGFFVRSTEPLAQVPEALLAAAARIEKGDFAARAPKLAGKFGTVAAALNSAAEVAGPLQAARGGAPSPATTDEWYQGPVRGAPAPQPAAPRQTAPMFTALASGGPATAFALQAAAPAAEADEESHWQQVFQDFLLTRASCGEAAEGLTYERFRQKLEANKAQLVAKYGCKTVRFQVYVKDGKAALKATPVK
jgi:hypothetical protein